MLIPIRNTKSARLARIVLMALNLLFGVGVSNANASLGAEAAAPNSVTLNWTAPGDDGSVGTASSYDIRYSTSLINDANWNSATQASGEPSPQAAGTPQTFSVTGLTPSTAYYFAIKAYDEAGNPSPLSNVVQKSTTAETTAPSAIANLSLTAATPSSITLNWTSPGDDGNSGRASQYDIRYSTALITDVNWGSATAVSGEPIPLIAGNAETFVVSGLSPSTVYFFAIKTADEVPNWSALSNVPNLSTSAENNPPANITSLAATGSTSTSVSLSWTSPGDDGSVGTASQYDLRYSTTAIDASNFASATQATGEPTPTVAGSVQTFTVNGLSSGVTYFFAIKTADEVPNWSGLSNVINRNTNSESTPPSAIANLNSSASDASTVTLTWTAPGDDGTIGVASTYDVRYSTSNITSGNFASATQATGEPSPASPGNAESFVVAGLNANTTYFFAVKTADEVPNWSTISNIVSRPTTTETTAPSAVANLTVVNPTQSSLTLNWTSVGDDGSVGTATSYDIRYSTSPINDANWNSATQVAGEPTPKVAGQSESFTVSGLSVSTTYYFAIKVSDEVPNVSALSNVANGATTVDNTPPSPINDLTAETGSFSGELLLTWTTVGDDGSAGGSATSYEIRYSTSPITSGNWNSAGLLPSPPAPLPPAILQGLIVKNLQPGVRYYTGIKASDERGNQALISNISSAFASSNIGLDNNGLVAVLSPADGAEIPSSQPMLRVDNEGAGPLTSFYFDVATDSNFFGLVANEAVPIQDGASTGWEVPATLQPEVVYFWRVRSDSLAYSATRTFTVSPNTHAYPNPFRISENDGVTFKELPRGNDLVVTAASGEVVRSWSGISGTEITWDGRNESGGTVASGVYLWFVPSTGLRGKLIVVR